MSAIFYQMFIFSPNDSSLKAMQNVFFLFHPKSSFRSRDIQFFVIFLFPHFLDSKGEMEVEFMMS